MAIFTLEALQAEQGDCFLLHFGSPKAPRFVLVDGGPGRDVYDSRLKPRLVALAKRFGPLELPLVVCSHIDGDHIGGVLALIRDTGSRAPKVKVKCLWHNRPLDLVGEADAERFAAIVRREEESERLSFSYIVSSVRQGDELYHEVRKARIKLNCGFKGLVMAPAKGHVEHAVGDLTMLVIGPDSERIDSLRKKWEKQTKDRSLELLLAESAKSAAEVAADEDSSVTNLSSIVFLAEHGGRSILMTGDARGDYIVDGLARAGRLRDGQARVDVLKLQHHGSSRNTSKEFFETVLADDYVISANGMYGDPDRATIDALVAARGQNGYRVWLTNGDRGTALVRTVAAIRRKYPKVELRVRPSGDDSQLIDLGDPVKY